MGFVDEVKSWFKSEKKEKPAKAKIKPKWAFEHVKGKK